MNRIVDALKKSMGPLKALVLVGFQPYFFKDVGILSVMRLACIFLVFEIGVLIWYL